MSITPDRYLVLKELVQLRGFGEDIAWARDIHPPEDPEAFAMEVAYVIINSGMRWTVARGIWKRVSQRLSLDMPIHCSRAFGHAGKTRAIDHVWENRRDLFNRFMALQIPAEQLAFLEGLPWIGGITKYHLAKNFGVDVAKPDRWLERVAHVHCQDVQAFCEELARATGDRVAVVDTVIWRCCAMGALQVTENQVLPLDPDLEAAWSVLEFRGVR